MFRALLIFAVSLSLTGCKRPLDKNFDTVKYNYKIGYHGNPTEVIFAEHDKDLGVMIVVVNKKIKRIGFNDRFTIIERVGNYNDLDAAEQDTVTFRYYIVDMTKKLNIQDKDFLYGPATSDEFLTRKKELGITGLDFTKEFKIY